jgi:L-2-hydroxyglutarate oxidase
VREEQFDIAVIGGGIIGLATALKLASRYPGRRLLVLEKEDGIGRHQTGHNSGVIHSGIYYRPGSLKARTCVAGRRALIEFCDENGIPYELCGKVIVATEPEEIPRLEELHRRGVANGVAGLERIGPERLREIEPHARGLQALFSPGTGIVDFARVAAAYAEKFVAAGGTVRTRQEVRAVMRRPEGLVVATADREWRTKYLVNCAGLHVDRVARLFRPADAPRPQLRIVPFRGEYYTLAPARRSLVRGLIYPVPDPRFPFLGVHFTRTIHGEVEAGPNAVLAFAREGYRKRDIAPRDLVETLCFGGFWRLARKHWRLGLEEFYRSASKEAFARALRRLVPEVQAADLLPGGAGVRAQAVGRNGALIDDFVIEQSGRAVHVLNAPSPGATASLAIAAEIVARCGALFDL